MKLHATNNDLMIKESERLISGSINMYSCEFTFDESWDGYAVTAVFSTGNRLVNMAVVDGKCDIPVEVLRPNARVRVGIFGVDGDRSKPTTYSDWFIVEQGTDATGSAGQPPTPSVYEQWVAGLDAKHDEWDGYEQDRQEAEAAREEAENERAEAEQARENLETGYVAQAAAQASNAINAATQAGNSAAAASASAKTAQSYAVGGSGTRAGEDVDNAKYYASIAREISGCDFVTPTEVKAVATEVLFEIGADAVVTPQMFGAVAGGKTDDTNAFLEAAAYCIANKKALFVPPGNYLTTESCVIGNIHDINIEGHVTNLTLKDDPNSGAHKTVKVDHCDNLILRDYKDSHFELGVITNLTIYANDTEVSGSAFAYNYLVGGYVKNLTLDSVGDGWINENTFERIRVVNLTIGGDYAHNHNKFYDISLESGTINIVHGTNNYISYRGEGGCTINLNEELSQSGNPMSANNIIEKTWDSTHGGFINNPTFSRFGNIVCASHLSLMSEKSIKRYDVYNAPFNDNSDFKNKLLYAKSWNYYGNGVVVELTDDLYVHVVGDKIRFSIEFLDEEFNVVDPSAIVTNEEALVLSSYVGFNASTLKYANTSNLDDLTAAIFKNDAVKYVKFQLRAGDESTLTAGAEIFVRSMKPVRVIDLDDGLVRSESAPVATEGVDAGFRVYNSDATAYVRGWEFTGEKWEEFYSDTTIRYTAQTLTEEQKAQARTNIDACAVTDVPPPVVESASGYEISVSDSAERPVQGLVLYGNTTQAGTPTADAPVELKSVGNDGAFETWVNSENYFGGIDPNNVSAYGEDVISGFAATGGKPVFYCSLKANTAYTISLWVKDLKQNTTYGTQEIGFWFRKKEDSVFYPAVAGGEKPFTSADKIILTDEYERISYTFTKDFDIDQIAIGYHSSGCRIAYDTSRVRIDLADETQSITVNTPNGLHGINVTGTAIEDRANYTDADGQKWLCDEVDFGRGVRVQRIGKIDSYSGETVGDVFMSTTGALTTGATVIYPLDAAVETAISAEEMAAYADLRTNNINTDVSNSDGAWMKLDYVADTKAYIKEVFVLKSPNGTRFALSVGDDGTISAVPVNG